MRAPDCLSMVRALRESGVPHRRIRKKHVIQAAVHEVVGLLKRESQLDLSFSEAAVEGAQGRSSRPLPAASRSHNRTRNESKRSALELRSLCIYSIGGVRFMRRYGGVEFHQRTMVNL
jgi:hypothetical protein